MTTDSVITFYWSIVFISRKKTMDDIMAVDDVDSGEESEEGKWLFNLCDENYKDERFKIVIIIMKIIIMLKLGISLSIVGVNGFVCSAGAALRQLRKILMEELFIYWLLIIRLLIWLPIHLVYVYRAPGWGGRALESNFTCVLSEEGV